MHRATPPTGSGSPNPAIAHEGSREYGPPEFFVEVAQSAAQVRRHVGCWQNLADNVENQNVFYEPWALLPALEILGQDRATYILFVYQSTGSQVRLVAVFPLEKKSHFRGAPFPHFVSWQHSQLFQATPIISTECPVDCWLAVLQWARTAGGLFLELPLIVSGLVSINAPYRRLMIERFERAAFSKSEATAAAYIAGSSSSKSRKSWRRQRRRLAEKGALDLRQFDRSENLDSWVGFFLKLEASGWKGRDGTAMQNNTSEATFFRTICKNAAEHNGLLFIGLFLDGQPIAMQCNLFSGGCGFAFKVAYDEAFSQFSPGVLLELDAIECFYGRDGLSMVDSCTSPRHPLMGRLWSETISVEHTLISTGGNLGNGALLALSVFQKLRKIKARRKNTALNSGNGPTGNTG